MVVLVDTNVIIDYYCEREEFYKASKAVMTWCGEDGVNGYVAFHSLPNIWFILRKSPEKIRREILLNICKVLTVAGADQEEVVKAIENSDFKDFEDCLQDRCAVSVAADYIVTRNEKDFAAAETKAITPEEFCELMEKQGEMIFENRDGMIFYQHYKYKERMGYNDSYERKSG